MQFFTNKPVRVLFKTIGQSSLQQKSIRGVSGKPSSSLVLSSHLRQRNLPPWTSYFVKYGDIVSDQRGLSHFNWEVDGVNYHILRTGCWPYIKYHCTRRPHENLLFEDRLFRVLKVLNLGIPCLAYGVAAHFLIRTSEAIVTPHGTVLIHFLYLEDKGARMSGHSRLVSDPTKVWQVLQGVFCVYKPPRMKLGEVRAALTNNIIRDLNAMEFPRQKKMVNIEGSLGSELKVKVVPNWSSHPLAVGEMYSPEDIKLSYSHKVTPYSSGVCLLGINLEGKLRIESLKLAQMISGYEVEGKLGVATSDLFYTGKPIEKSSFQYTTRGRMERVLGQIEGAHRKKMVDTLGVPPNSQQAYEALSEDGFLKPISLDDPLIYSVKLGKFRPPHFTVEFHGVNISDEFLLGLVNDIGLFCKTNAHTIKMRCFQRGPFTATDHCLVRGQWRLQEVINNLQLCRDEVQKIHAEYEQKIPLTKADRILIAENRGESTDGERRLLETGEVEVT